MQLAFMSYVSVPEKKKLIEAMSMKNYDRGNVRA